MSGQARGSRTIARVLDAALDAFADGGLTAMSVQEIRERSGVSVGSLYHHFGNRAGIVLALYRRSLLALLDQVHAGAMRTRSAQGLVHAMITHYFDWVEANPVEARFVLCAAPAELDAKAAEPMRAATLERVGPLVERAVHYAAAGEIISLPPEFYELVVIGPVSETASRWLLGEPLDLVQARTVLARTAWRALSP